MKILLTGASGFIGSHILHGFARNDCSIRAVSRKEPSKMPVYPNVEWIQIDFSQAINPEDWFAALNGIDVVINAVGIIQENTKQTFSILHTEAPIALFMACKGVGIKRVIQLSALGVDKNATTAYQTSKLEADNFLRNSELYWTILQPSIVYGQGDHSMTFFKAMAAQPLVTVIADGNQMVQPIHVGDLSKAVVLSALENQGMNQTIAATGADAISFIELMQHLRSWLGLGRARIVNIPLFVMKLLSHIGDRMSGSMLTTQTLTMLEQGNCASTNPFKKTYGFFPRGIISELKRKSATSQDRIGAGLFFLKNILRYAIVIVWMWSGIVSALFAVEKSYALLAKLGLQGIWADLSLYGASTVDVLLGIAVLTRLKPRLSSWIQVVLIVIYTCIITWFIPGYWFDPFGAVLKNIPLVVAILIWGILDEE